MIRAGDEGGTWAVARGTPLARRITDGLEPRAWTVAVALLTGWRAEGAAGVGWGAFAAFLASATGPWVLAGYVLALVGRSRVRLRDHAPRRRPARPWAPPSRARSSSASSERRG
ncbi:hypothetical protein SLAVM298S_07232 [Streptomyces lavendulae subsp. lavendulae]